MFCFHMVAEAINPLKVENNSKRLCVLTAWQNGVVGGSTFSTLRLATTWVSVCQGLKIDQINENLS